MKQTISWNTGNIDYDTLKNGQLILCKFENEKIPVFFPYISSGRKLGNTSDGRSPLDFSELEYWTTFDLPEQKGK